jgi:hypothetical protein
MNKIKLITATLILSVTGVVYAANDQVKQNAKSCNMDKAASCCASGANCCDGGSCSTAHTAEHNQASAQASKTGEKESCCQADASCCTSGASCCAKHKATGKQTAERAGMTHEDGASCCVAGAECCKDGGSCCSKHTH